MYLHGYKSHLGALGALDSKAQAFYNAGAWEGTDPINCQSSGGVVSVQYVPDYSANALIVVAGGWVYANPRLKAVFSCAIPASSAPAPAAAVNTTVQTTVSPQISPNLIQQDEPSNSGVSAGTSQSSPAAQTSGDQDSFLTTIQNLLDRARETSSPGPDSVFVAAPVPDAGVVEAGAGQIAAPSKLEQYTPLLVFAAAAIGLATVLKRSKLERGK